MVFSAIVASVYPAIMWWYLSRPAARAACMKQPEPELPEPNLAVGNDSLNLARLIFGHLAGIECRRGLRAAGCLWLRALVGTLLATGAARS